MVKITFKAFKEEYSKLNPNDSISVNELKELHKGMSGSAKVRKTKKVRKGKSVKIITRPTFEIHRIPDPQDYSYVLGKNRVAKIVDAPKPKMINVKVPVVKMVEVERKKPTKKASGEKAPPKKRGRPKKVVNFE